MTILLKEFESRSVQTHIFFSNDDWRPTMLEINRTMTREWCAPTAQRHTHILCLGKFFPEFRRSRASLHVLSERSCNPCITNGWRPLRLLREQEYMKSSNQNKPFVIPMYSGFNPCVALSVYTRKVRYMSLDSVTRKLSYRFNFSICSSSQHAYTFLDLNETRNKRTLLHVVARS